MNEEIRYANHRFFVRGAIDNPESMNFARDLPFSFGLAASHFEALPYSSVLFPETIQSEECIAICRGDDRLSTS